MVEAASRLLTTDDRYGNGLTRQPKVNCVTPKLFALRLKVCGLALDDREGIRVIAFQ